MPTPTARGRCERRIFIPAGLGLRESDGRSGNTGSAHPRRLAPMAAKLPSPAGFPSRRPGLILEPVPPCRGTTSGWRIHSRRTNRSSSRVLSQPVGIHLNFALGLSNELRPAHATAPSSPSRWRRSSDDLIRGHPVEESDEAVDLPEQQRPGVRRYRSAVERGAHRAAPPPLKREGKAVYTAPASFLRRGCGQVVDPTELNILWGPVPVFWFEKSGVGRPASHLTQRTYKHVRHRQNHKRLATQIW